MCSLIVVYLVHGIHLYLRSQLIGKVGRVVSSQTLGGWHEVSLEAAGGVVRVQRNALEVLSLAPAVPGASVHGHPSGGGRSSGGSHRASTLGASARGSTSAAAAARALGGASVADPRASSSGGGSRHQGSDGGAGGGASSRTPPSRSGDPGLPDDGGTMSQRPAGGKRKRSTPAAALRERASPGGVLRSSGSGGGGAAGATRGTVANFDALQYDSLKRYRAAYGLNVDVDCSRDELVRAVRRHFASSSVDELQVISDFLRRVRHCSSPAL